MAKKVTVTKAQKTAGSTPWRAAPGRDAPCPGPWRGSRGPRPPPQPASGHPLVDLAAGGWVPTQDRRSRRMSPTEGEPRHHLVTGPVAALARQVRRDDGDLRRDPRRPGIRREHAHPPGGVLGPGEPAQGQVRHERPALRRRPGHRAGRPHAARQPRQRLDPSVHTVRTGNPRPEHLRPGHVREAPTSRDRQRRPVGSAPATTATPSTTSSTTRSGAAPMNARVRCHWPGDDHRSSGPDDPGARRGTRRGARRHPRGVRSTRTVAWAHHPPRPQEWRADLRTVVRLAP